MNHAHALKCPAHAHGPVSDARSRSYPSRGPVPTLSLSTLRQTLQFIRDPIPLIERGLAECGEVFGLRILGFGTWVFVCSAAGVENMVRTSPDALVSGELNRRMLKPFAREGVLFTLDGEAHLARKRLLLPFFQEQHVIHHLETVERITRRIIDSWPIGKPFALMPHAQDMSFQIIMETVFGLDVFAERAPLVKLLRRVQEDVLTSPLLAMPALQLDLGRFSPWGKIKRLHARALVMLEALIAERRASNFRDRKDVLSQLLVLQAQHPDLTDSVILGECLSMMDGGFQAPSFITAWAVECALSEPDVLDRIRGEVDEVVGGAPFERAHLGRLAYLEAVIHESIRHRMPSAIAGLRLVKKPVSLLGYDLPVGALVSMSMAGLGLREDVFPEPSRFRPERFLERKYSAFEWNLFGSGTRQCVGKGLGQATLKVTLATIFKHANLRLVDENRRRQRSGLFFVPRRGLRVVLESRR